MSDVLTVPVAVEYPDSDGKPMAENDAQRKSLLYAVGVLEDHFEHQDDVYVSGDLLIYYEEGNPRVSVAPDVFVVKGVASHERFTYLVWEEGKVRWSRKPGTAQFPPPPPTPPTFRSWGGAVSLPPSCRA